MHSEKYRTLSYIWPPQVQANAVRSGDGPFDCRTVSSDRSPGLCVLPSGNCLWLLLYARCEPTAPLFKVDRQHQYPLIRKHSKLRTASSLCAGAITLHVFRIDMTPEIFFLMIIRSFLWKCLCWLWRGLCSKMAFTSYRGKISKEFV